VSRSGNHTDCITAEIKISESKPKAVELLDFQSCPPAGYGLLPGNTGSSDSKFCRSLDFPRLIPLREWFTAGWDLKLLRPVCKMLVSLCSPPLVQIPVLSLLCPLFDTLNGHNEA
jgi:hypothetical protein